MIKSQMCSTTENSAENQTPTIAAPQIIDSVNNRIYFYTHITSESILRLTKSLMDLDAKHISDAILNSEDSFRTIWLHINSPGGFILDGLAAMDQISMTKSPVCTVVDGICASAATLISIKGKRRLIKPNSFMLIHQLSSGLWGTYEEMKDGQKNADKLMALLTTIYTKNTKIPAKLLKQILQRDLYFDAKESLKYGLVDEII